MKNSEIHNRINLRSMMIDAQTSRAKIAYGEKSINFHGEHHKASRSLFVYSILKPLILNSYATTL